MTFRSRALAVSLLVLVAACSKTSSDNGQMEAANAADSATMGNDMMNNMMSNDMMSNGMMGNRATTAMPAGEDATVNEHIVHHDNTATTNQ